MSHSGQHNIITQTQSYPSSYCMYGSAPISYPPAPIEIRTRVSGFKVLSDNRYTIRAKNTNSIFNLNKPNKNAT